VEETTLRRQSATCRCGKFSCTKHLREFHLHPATLGGMKFPSGDSNRLDRIILISPQHRRHDLTLGSGSFDGLLAPPVREVERLFFAADMQYAIRSKGGSTIIAHD